jgi:predicted transposase YdaD
MRGFFEEHGAEVVNMLMTEWKLEDALVVEREEGWEEGLEAGQKIGWEAGREKGLETGQEEAAKNLSAFGMGPEEIARALKLPLDTVRHYLAM